MLFKGVSIESVKYELPPLVVTLEEIEERLAPVYERLKLPYGRLELMTGIKELRFWDPGTLSSHGAVLAGRKAIEAVGLKPAEIGCVVHASVCRDFVEPATASVIHKKLGLVADTHIFDVSNACLGVLNSIVLVANMIQTGQRETGLIVSGETAESLHEATIERILADKALTRSSFKKHFASLTIGSGASAVLLVNSERSQTGHELIGGAVRADTKANNLCQEDKQTPHITKGPLMTTDSEALLYAGCALAEQAWAALKAELGWDNDSPDYIFTHQVGVAHKRLLFKSLCLDPAKDFSTVDFLGNTGSSALPTAFAMGVEKQKIQKDDLIALLGIGSGLSSLMLGIKW